MEFEWDEEKRISNLTKHHVDFLRRRQLFDGRPIVTGQSRRGEEERNVSTGVIEHRFYTVVWILRGDVIRIISARSARDGEKRTYRAIHG